MVATFRSWAILSWIACLVKNGLAAVPTWPDSTDELEDIMFLNSGYRARGFSTAVTPCGSSTKGPGRNAAAEWLRTAFHDMATANAYSRGGATGGIDASLMYELDSGENIGDAFNTTFTTFAPFLSSRSSMSDIIALGVYTSVRACSGPIIPIRTGRKDATAGGPIGVPLPQNDIGTFENQFLRMGFNTTAMIMLVACGHTIGGVHAVNFPEIVPTGQFANDYALFDSTSADSTAKFDEKVASEYASSHSTDPLVVLGISNTRNSDYKVFNADRNVTVDSLANAATFTSVCQTMLQQMIEIVPAGTAFTNPIVAYEVKPYALQLTLQAGGSNILFTGGIRVRTTSRVVSAVQLTYLDRTGANGGTIATTSAGTGSGFDDTFTFYEISTQLSAASSISSFTVTLTLQDGSTQTFDNNGAGYPVQDSIMFQSPQSCLSASADASGNQNLTIVAAVRNTETATPTLGLTLRVPQSLPSNLAVPSLLATSVPMTQLYSAGPYNIFGASYAAPASQASSARFDVTVGTESDSFKDTSNIGSTCSVLGSSTSSSTSSSATSTSTSTSTSVSQPTSTAFSYLGCFTDSVNERAFTGAAYDGSTMTVESCASSCSLFQYFGVEYGDECYCGNTRDSNSVSAAESDCSMPCAGNSNEMCGNSNRLSVYKNLLYNPIVEPTIRGYAYQGCYNDTTASRVLKDSSTASSSMTVEECETFCNGAAYFGVEYGAECYCGSTLSSTSAQQPETDCNMVCAGNSSEYCGAGNRLNLYALPPGPMVDGWIYQYCSNDSVAARVLTGNAKTDGSGMSYEECASFCSGYGYFGVEYGAECYCGNSFTNPSAVEASSDCNMACSGNANETCGGPNRLNLFKNFAGGPINPAVPGWTYKGCYTDSTAARTLTAGFQYDADMTVEMCASFCQGSTYFGTEYGAECYCGDAFDNGGTVAVAADCSFACPGDKAELCGAGNRLSVYVAS